MIHNFVRSIFNHLLKPKQQMLFAATPKPFETQTHPNWTSSHLHYNATPHSTQKKVPPMRSTKGIFNIQRSIFEIFTSQTWIRLPIITSPLFLTSSFTSAGKCPQLTPNHAPETSHNDLLPIPSSKLRPPYNPPAQLPYCRNIYNNDISAKAIMAE